MLVLWSQPAVSDLEEILEYIAFDSPDSATSIYSRIKDACVSLETTPTVGRVVPQLALRNINGYREIIILHWSVIYRIEDKCITILAVLDCRRDLDHALISRAIHRITH